MRVMSKGGHAKTLRRPLQHIYPLEVRQESLDGEPVGNKTSQGSEECPTGEPNSTPPHSAGTAGTTDDSSASSRPVRRAAIQARDRILGCVMDD